MTEKEILDDLASYFENGWADIIRQYNKYIDNRYPFCEESCLDFVQSGFFAVMPYDQAEDLSKYTGEEYSVDDEDIHTKYQKFVSKKIYGMISLDKHIDQAREEYEMTPELIDYYINYRSELNRPKDFRTELGILVDKYDVSSDQLRSAIRSPEVKKSLSTDNVR